MSESTTSPPPDATQVASPGPTSPISEAPTSPVPAPDVPTTANGAGNGVDANKKDSDPAKPPIQTEKSNGGDSKPEATRRQSTIKVEPKAPQARTPRPGRKRRASTASVQSRYSEMTMDYFETIPAKYNAWASWFTWILLAGFVLGPGAQQAARNATDIAIVQKAVNKVPLLVVSIVCSGVGGLGMIGLWIRWRHNYIWLIHKIFFPGFLNGLAGTLASAVNTWAIQGGHFRFNAEAIISLSITGGSTVICLVLTIIYQLVLRSVKREHRRMLAAAENDPEVPTLKETAGEQDYSAAEDSIWNALTN